MAARVKRDKIIPISLLILWLLLHAVALLGVLQEWRLTFGLVVTAPLALILATPLYVWLVHALDTQLKLGGLGSHIRDWTPATSGPPTARPALANQTVTVTTGFAGILLFSTVRFQNDLRAQQILTEESYATLVTVAVAFCLACVLNLIQLLLLRLVDHPALQEDVKRGLRLRLRVLNVISWHSLVTPVVLLLLLLRTSRPALLVNAFYSGCLFWYYFTTVPYRPVEPVPNKELQPTVHG